MIGLKKPMHIFLTGGIQVGKTTVIRRFLKLSGLAADGFITFWEAHSGGIRKLYLSPFCSDMPPAKKHIIAHHDGQRLFLPENISDVFNELGGEILDASGKRDIIIMDELGFMESDATVFHEAVMRHILGKTPILGVIKPMRSGFLDGIRSHPNVAVKEVTPETRDVALEHVLKQFSAVR